MNKINFYKAFNKIQSESGMINNCVNMGDGNLKLYIDKLLKEKETLVAYYLEATGESPENIELVHQNTENGFKFYVQKRK